MRMKITPSNPSWCLAFLVMAVCPPLAGAQAPANVHQATLMESDQKTKEVSTEELRKILADKSATVFDARPFREYAVSHIPGAINVSAKPGMPMSLYVSDVAEIGRVLKGTKAAPIVLTATDPCAGRASDWPPSFWMRVTRTSGDINWAFRSGERSAG